MTEQEREGLIEAMAVRIGRAQFGGWVIKPSEKMREQARAALEVAEPVIREQADVALREESAQLREETDEWEKSHNTLVEEIERLRALEYADDPSYEITRLREENARLWKERDLLHAILSNVALSMEAFDNYADIHEGGKDE